MWVVDRRRVARHYLSTWFLLDAFTIFVPASGDVYLAAMGSDAGSGSNFASNITILRVLRCVRLTKLVRLVRTSRVYERMKLRISLTYGQLLTVECVVLLILSAHWFACLMTLAASLHSNPQETWLGDARFGICPARPLIDPLSNLTASSTPAAAYSATSISSCAGVTSAQ